MGLLGVSLIIASFAYVLIRRPACLSLVFTRWRAFVGAAAEAKGKDGKDDKAGDADTELDTAPRIQDGKPVSRSSGLSPRLTGASRRNGVPPDRMAMPPPPLPKLTVGSPAIDEPSSTPSALMPPPPLPPLSRPSGGRIPTLPKAQFPAANSAQRARGPAPNRSLPSLAGGGGLLPPPTLASKPQKPSKKVVLDPGHSPLDWARISGPDADLRGLPPSTPYIRVTPSMLKKQTGRKGKDAWMALNGKVYNVTPYVDFHPGGVPELMRGAGRDGTKLFGEIHPWVNYETMLAACLVGLMVEEPTAGASEIEMDQMD
ncbi:heme/steroid binding protein [Drechmeria coniospora]|uniref:Heme/steroid binding protein n=1 Tax=Drechmeria coniospora TaxID=98403 RepID=A0A151GKF2_DRECN|nr:heme/steroid binding protein [Drechmeria coniospora]KYK57569.1 heme/steroid binding protein [Drechmeria coniospora]ODA79460.1 hypothetical protein RJ55_05053 [Drechmeria coniospora]